jgi:sterol desaturase/sphingolipid hydroxylase (fatty acid hydroxylase superfamily)
MEYIPAFLQSKSALVLMALAVFLTLDRVFPAVRVAGGWPRVFKNLSLALANGFLGWLVVVPISAFAAQHALEWRPIWWSGAAGLAIDLLILDLWIYWWHRANHEVSFLWRFHQVHHLDQFLDASSALRFHFGEVFLSALVRALVMFLIGVPLQTVVLFETVLAFATMFHHSNVRLPQRFERLISLVIVTPSIHWVHHHALRADTDSNYSTVLSIWDRLFGSRSATVRTPAMPIGVEGARDLDAIGLLKRPFIP